MHRYMPLPRAIHKDQYEERFATISDHEKEIARKWYIFDANTDFYRLVHLTDKDDPEYWNEAYPVLLKALDGVEFAPSLFIGRSVTELEAWYAMLNPDGALWWRRIFTNPEMAYPVHPDDMGRELRDKRDNAKAQTNLDALLEEMKKTLLPQNIHEQSVSVEAYKEQGPNASQEHRDYFKGFEENYLEAFKGHVEALIQRKQDWDRDGSGVGLPGESLDEMLHHCLWARTKFESFQGRESLIEECMARIVEHREEGEYES